MIFHSRPVHSLMLSSHRFLCLPLRLPPWTVPNRKVLASPRCCLQDRGFKTMTVHKTKVDLFAVLDFECGEVDASFAWKTQEFILGFFFHLPPLLFCFLLFFDCLVGCVVKVLTSRAQDLGFDSGLCRRDFSGVESYQWLTNLHSRGYTARRLVL